MSSTREGRLILTTAITAAISIPLSLFLVYIGRIQLDQAASSMIAGLVLGWVLILMGCES